MEKYKEITLDYFIRDRHWDERSSKEAGLFMIALHIAVSRHWDQKRTTGEPYYQHLLSVAKLLEDWGFGVDIQVAGLLHDVVEDCEITLPEIKKIFGKKITFLVDGTTIDCKANKPEYFKKLVKYTSKHYETVFIKLADRYHNLLTVKGMGDPAREERFLKETIGPFKKSLEECQEYIPKKNIALYKNLLSSIFDLANKELS